MSVINPISAASAGVPSVTDASQVGKAAGSNPLDPGKAAGSFIDAVNDLQEKAGALQKSLYSDNPVELHRVMIAAEEAGTAMDLLLEVRNKLVEAYQELMRMPV